MPPRTPALALAVALVPSLAAAQTSAEVEASWRLLVQQAQAAQSTGDHARALDLALRAGSIHASPSLHRFVAQEQALLGQVVPALASAQRCVDALTADRSAPERAATLATCTALVRDLERRVGRLVVEVPAPAPAGLDVRVAGAALPPALFGVPYLVAPGSVSVEATAPGRVALRRSVDVASGGTASLRLQLAELARPAPAPAPPVPPPVAPPRGVARSSSPHRPLAWATAIGGAVGLVTGGVLAGVREGAVASFNDAGCIEDHGVATPTGDCPGQQSTANALAPAVVAAFVAGGALAATSVVLWATAPSGGERRAAVACAPALGAAGVVCGGRF